MRKTLDIIVDEKQSEAFKNTILLQLLSAIF